MSPKTVLTPEAVGLNDNWGNLATDVPAILTSEAPLVMGVQEAYRQDYRKILPRRWGVQQNEADKATAGVACIWDRERLHRAAPGRYDSHAHRVGAGWEALAKGTDTRMRGVGWVDLKWRDGQRHPGLPHRFRLASAHRLPLRDRHLWPEFDEALEQFLRRSPLPALILMDCNESGGPQNLMHLVGAQYRWVGIHIDGVLSALPTTTIRDLPRLTSDHNAVAIGLGWTKELHS